MRAASSSCLILGAILCGTSITHTAPVVVGVSPSSHSLSSLTTVQVVVTFDVAMDPLTIVPGNIMVFGHWSGVMAGQFQLENGNTRVRFTPARPFSAGEVVMVSLSKNVKSQGGQSLASGYAWTFWIKPSLGTMNLQPIAQIPVRRTGEGHIQTYGAYAGDFDGDGFNDFAVPNELSNDVRVFLNNGSGGYGPFVVFPLPSGSFPSTNEGADFNGDGILDFAVGNSQADSVCVMIGNGTGGFSSLRNYRAASGIRGLSVMDLDGDGDMDIVTANRAADNLTILKNNGDGTFAPRIIVEANGSQETSCAAADANGDGILDLFVGAYNSSEIIVMLGDGNGGLTYSHKVSAGGRPWMIAVGDVDRDGKVDVVSANSNTNSIGVIRGDGAGHLLPVVTYPVGVFPLAIDLGDIDGDGDLDVVSSNYTSGTWTVYENNGSGGFSNPRTLSASSAGSCATLHDRDNDGDVDLTGVDEIDDLLFLFENRPPTSVSDGRTYPDRFTLEQNYPNPFNPTTMIRFSLPSEGVANGGVELGLMVKLKVYDVLGQEVATLVNERLQTGLRTVEFDGAGLPSGTYIYRLSSGSLSESRRMFLLK